MPILVGLIIVVLYCGFAVVCTHTSFSPHSSHLGRRAVHVYLPKRISQWWASDRSSRGMWATSSLSVCSGVLHWGVSPSRADTLKTCVSTGMAGIPKAPFSMTFAELDPETKNSVSHRHNALMLLLAALDGENV